MPGTRIGQPCEVRIHIGVLRGDRVALYPNDASLDAQLAMRTPQDQTAVNVGKNWTVTTAAPDQVKKWLGGAIVGADG